MKTPDASKREIAWARAYDAYNRLAATEEMLGELIQPARDSYRRQGQVPDWCGAEFLRGWAFLLARAEEAVGADEWDAVLEALRKHPASDVRDRPPVRLRKLAATVHTLPTEFSDKPKMHRDADFLRRKQARLWEPHVAAINSFVEEIRAERGQYVPYVDPDSGGVLAHVLFVLESPAKPASHGSTMLSADNDDATAANMWTAYRESGLPRTHGLHWNATPWYVGDGLREKNVSNAQMEAGHQYLLDLLKLAPDLRVVVAMGVPARDSLLRIGSDLKNRGVVLLQSIHPSPKNNARGGRQQVQEIFRAAYELASGTELQPPGLG